MILHGENVILKADGVAIAAAKSCEVTINVDTDEIASSTDGKWKRYMVGRKSWQASASQLVTTVIRNTEMVGKEVAIDLNVSGEVGLPFDGFVDNVTIEQQSLSVQPSFIYWDKTRKKFIAAQQSSPLLPMKYYINWLDGEAYTTPSDYDVFTAHGSSYIYLNSNLNADRLTGNALVTKWNGKFTKMNLAQGSFEFLGNGALTPASLPST